MIPVSGNKITFIRWKSQIDPFHFKAYLMNCKNESFLIELVNAMLNEQSRGMCPSNERQSKRNKAKSLKSRASWLTNWLIEWFTELFTNWLIDSLTDKLTDWLNYRLTDKWRDWLQIWIASYFLFQENIAILFVMTNSGRESDDISKKAVSHVN